MRLFTSVLTCLFLSVPLAAADEPVTLKVKPVLCIIDARTPECDLSFLVVWRSDSSGYYCVFNDFEEAPLRCWDRATGGELEDERTVREAFQYWITLDRSDTRIAYADVEVLVMDSGDRRRNRRTRHVWDLL